MTITLYNTADDKKKVGKTLTAVQTVENVKPIEPCDMLNPSFILDGGAVNAINSNYCHVSIFGRYYFITDHVLLNGARIMIKCKHDPLQNFATALKNSRQLVTRSESIGKPTYIKDDYLPLKPHKEIKIIPFEGGAFNLNTATTGSYNFVINVSGGSGE